MGIDGAEIGRITGEETVQAREAALKSFRTSKTKNVLFISGVAGEGVNLVVERARTIMFFIASVYHYTTFRRLMDEQSQDAF
jgi:hypothetical protein